MKLPGQIPLPDELAAEQPSPYWRRRGTAGVRSGRTRSAARLLKLTILGLLLPLAILYAAYWLAMKTASSRRFLLHPDQDVTLEGNHFVARQDIFSVLGFGGARAGRSFNSFKLDLPAERRSVETIPWIASATLTRIFPHQLLVRVVERTPVAFADVDGHIELVDKEGVFLPMPEKSSLDFPVLFGLGAAGKPSGRRARLEPYLQFLHATTKEVAQSGWIVSEANLDDPNDLKILLVQGSETILVHFGDSAFERRFKNFALLAPKVLASHPRIDSMDLRYHNEVVVDPFRPPSPGSKAKP